MLYVINALQKELLRELLINGRDLHDESDCREGYMLNACPGMGLPCSEYTREDAIRLLLEHMKDYD